MAIISEWIITHDGVTYPAGKVIFNLPVKLTEQYVAEGIAERVPVVNNAEGSPNSNNDNDNALNNGATATGEDGGAAANIDGDNDSDNEEALTPEEFGKLGAAEQKKELEQIGLIPDSNAAARLTQYTEWYGLGEEDEII